MQISSLVHPLILASLLPSLILASPLDDGRVGIVVRGDDCITCQPGKTSHCCTASCGVCEQIGCDVSSSPHPCRFCCTLVAPFGQNVVIGVLFAFHYHSASFSASSSAHVISANIMGLFLRSTTSVTTERMFDAATTPRWRGRRCPCPQLLWTAKQL